MVDPYLPLAETGLDYPHHPEQTFELSKIHRHLPFRYPNHIRFMSRYHCLKPENHPYCSPHQRFHKNRQFQPTTIYQLSASSFTNVRRNSDNPRSYLFIDHTIFFRDLRWFSSRLFG